MARDVHDRNAIKFFDSIASLDFSILPFLTLWKKSSNDIKWRIINVVMSFIDDLALEYDMAMILNPDTTRIPPGELALMLEGKRMQEAMRPYTIRG